MLISHTHLKTLMILVGDHNILNEMSTY